MDRSRLNKWMTFWFFFPTSIAMVYFLFYLSTFAADAANMETGTSAKAKPAYQVTPAFPDRVILTKGVPRTVDRIKLTYLGMDDDSLIIDVTILDLDPQYAYRRAIPRQVAELGFSLGQQQYRLISVGSSRLKISRTSG